ncbi:hypothetical protein RZS08_47340, partial [Arthrospira platensis SPKY1]|nr:hypothetical protein [Arthrospira platensis SPKY1]
MVVATDATSPTLTGIAANHVTFENCNMLGGYYGFSLGGGSTLTDLSVGNKVINCKIQDFALYGTYIRGQDSLIFDGNDITRENRSVVTTFYGFSIWSAW